VQTCDITIDNYVDALYVDGVAIVLPAACARSWYTKCAFTFADTSHHAPQLLAIAGSELQTYASGGYCSKSGLALACKSTLPGSTWNDVKSDVYQLSSYSAAAPLASTSTWFANGFAAAGVATSGNAVASTSAFHCTSCMKTGNGATCVRVRALRLLVPCLPFICARLHAAVQTLRASPTSPPPPRPPPPTRTITSLLFSCPPNIRCSGTRRCGPKTATNTRTS
jgi:hypothetical protein